MSDNNRERDKIIDVTKPRQSNPSSNIDASRVSAHTLREQQALEKLKRQVGSLDQRENRGKQIKTIIAIILIIILIAIAVIFMVMINKQTVAPEENYDVRLSVKVDGKDSLVTTDTGTEKLQAVFPGDRLKLSAYVRNSNKPTGDVQGSNDYTPKNIYVRFKILFILDYEIRYDVLKPKYNNKLWYRYNEDDEKLIVNGAKKDDMYYYYMGSLSFLEKVDLFEYIDVDGESLDCDDGGKYGQIQIIVESIEADYDSVTNGTLWGTAPRKWVIDLSMN